MYSVGTGVLAWYLCTLSVLVYPVSTLVLEKLLLSIITIKIFPEQFSCDTTGC